MSINPDISQDPDIFMEQVAQLIEDELICPCIGEEHPHRRCLGAYNAQRIVLEQAQRYVSRPVIELTADGWYEIPGKGKVASFGKGHIDFDPKELNNTWVKIDGKEYWVSGVEKFLIGDEIPYRLPFGLLVRAKDE